jgi:imidazolonepropionase-like amidohydrolase
MVMYRKKAWKFVTLNPAKLLHIDDKAGSIKVGKMLILFYGYQSSVNAQAEKRLSKVQYTMMLRWS